MSPSIEEPLRGVVISAPSGGGKTTLCKYLLRKVPTLSFSVSATTRPPRTYEKHGRDYYFLSEEDFISKKEKHEFIEYETMYDGVYYGTLFTELHRLRGAGKCALFDVDVKGALTLKKYFGRNAIAVFIAPTNINVLEKRLIERGKNTQEDIARRMQKAQEEMTYQGRFDVVIVNRENKYHLAAKALLGCIQDFLSQK